MATRACGGAPLFLYRGHSSQAINLRPSQAMNGGGASLPDTKQSSRKGTGSGSSAGAGESNNRAGVCAGAPERQLRMLLLSPLMELWLECCPGQGLNEAEVQQTRPQGLQSVPRPQGGG